MEQTPILKIGTYVRDHDDTRLQVTAIKHDTVVFDNGKEVSHREIELALNDVPR